MDCWMNSKAAFFQDMVVLWKCRFDGSPAALLTNRENYLIIAVLQLCRRIAKAKWTFTFWMWVS